MAPGAICRLRSSSRTVPRASEALTHTPHPHLIAGPSWNQWSVPASRRQQDCCDKKLNHPLPRCMAESYLKKKGQHSSYLVTFDAPFLLELMVEEGYDFSRYPFC